MLWEVQDQCAVRLVSGEAHFPTALLRDCKALIPFHEDCPLGPNHLLKDHLLIPLNWELGSQHMNLEQGT